MRVRLLLVVMLAAGATAFAGLAAPRGESRAMSCASPLAHAPAIENRTSRGAATFLCDYSWETYSWTVRLSNASGNVLAQRSGTSSGSTQHLTARVGCAGAWVHSFGYRNWNGSGASDSSVSVFC